jgi:hypothetical protein
MNDIYLTFFGSPQIYVSGLLVEPDTRKATALLAYLVATKSGHYDMNLFLERRVVSAWQ